MSERLLSLAKAIQTSGGGIEMEEGAETIEVSVPASTAASLYEKVRVTLEYSEDHLLRRNAIARMLRRFLGSDLPLENMASSLVHELVWAKYLPNKQIPTKFINKLSPIFLKYGPLLQSAENTCKPEFSFQWVLDVLSTELEYVIVSHQKEELMVSYMYEQMKTRIEWDPGMLAGQEEKDLLLFIAIHKTLLKSDLATLRYRTLSLYYPDWDGPSTPARIDEVATGLSKIIATVDGQIGHPIVEKLSQKLRRQAGLFRVLQDVIEDNPTEFEIFVTKEPDLFGRAIWKALKKRTKVFRSRLKRTAMRAVLFLFITKMALAVILEVPYDLIIHGQLFVMPLVINILFHPFFLAFISMTVVVPEHSNADDYKSAARALVVGANHDFLNIRIKKDRFGTWTTIFTIVYVFVFLAVYSVIGVLLYQINFNAFSIALFLFFLSLVTFFGIRIRSSTRDILLSPQRRGVFGSIFDIVVLPIVHFGRWLSVKVSKINVFIYFFDFIIESPFKVAVRFIEEWFAFIKDKREEI
ncbi:MAG: hypothetical protein ACD_9C00120G0002 [uncultured bacterium]|uniref:Uncharacterized protein n=1 Tax=Candidatus Uhrbacteria bacterium GW2011_GWC1_41_20 TaxID=1618983 RepID=A0A0G0YF56_9BACT|nr:MAG: hypothetical protein ACD_9C00120G0002 [uncultured bacterium]KKR22248.1 MAG: hypothetical protein UT52_C0018G0019 [Candidatus Uhrbacteria bacterium GW2011_GWE1_39_46]KKR63294.1 MAG: hypothetical protein UU04_C0021G0017 [Candidatus Uhrbacteria bacterium GW2011_GWC2_40_450]KKR90772.1 MAG: hypothetical protein UU36_C0002G0011 [Candidatus Uhrbacteria bacterium GW2011_GWE2_41_1153]KKR95560.1 MAG: hypothetical protein UU46_C0020G0009 [Candidatus Uhrbacteria bacterium GW2011_GWD1_41_16]KKR9897